MKSRTRYLIVGIISLLLMGGGFAILKHRSGSGSTLGQSFNAGIDNLQAASIRLMELPTFLLLMGTALLAVLIVLPIMRWGTRSGRVTWARAIVTAVAATALMGLALSADRRMSQLQSQVRDLRNEVRHLRMAGTMDDGPAIAINTPPADNRPAAPAASNSTPATSPATSPGQTVAVSKPNSAKPKRDKLMVDATKLQQNFSVLFGQTSVRPVIHDEATDVVEVNMPSIPVVAYMAVVNLKTPGLEIKFGGSLTQKTMTSDFAKQNDCQIAINGEAGASPQANSGLGSWRGHMMVNGKVIMGEDTMIRRPFLSFDKDGKPTFIPQLTDKRTLPADAYNVIWGRLDAIVDTKVQTVPERDRQPRTAMGINADGSKLFLMVVDGRQQRYSIGFTREEVGVFMQAFGGTNGMLCDEGGSSCIYLRRFGGIVNSPSDGEERPTYTHFGISLKPQ